MRISETWVDKPLGTKADHWIDLIYKEDGQNDWWVECSVKSDGCIHYNQCSNLPFGDVDQEENDIEYLHICDLDNFIERMIKLRDKAKEHFGDKWGNYNDKFTIN